MKATDILKHEHKIVLLILAAGKRESEAIQDHGAMATDRLEKIIDFCQVFIDKCHHGKEEEYLFPKMQERGMAGDRGPIAVLLQEHQHGRERLKAIEDAFAKAKRGDGEARSALAVNLCAYVESLRAHIDKEDNVVFPMTEELFTPADQEALVAAFEKHEAEEMGAGVHERYHQLAHELA